jgi:PAS domain S-box-containing protein
LAWLQVEWPNFQPQPFSADMNKALQVLQVQDSQSDAVLIVGLLGKTGYAVREERIETAAEMRAALAIQTWDVVIADYRLPQFDAPAALAILQEMGLDIPFIVVSGTIGEDIAVSMMKAGAHDYLMKDKLARLGPAVERELEEAQTRQTRRQAEEALRQREALLLAVTEGTSDAVFVKDSQGRYLLFNTAAAAFAGRTSREVLGKDATALFPPEEARRVTAGERRVMESGMTQTYEDLITTGGILRTFLSTKGPIRDQHGNVIGLFGISRDITERKKSEAALLESKEKLTKAFHAVPDSILITRMQDGRILECNDRFTTMMGYSRQEALGRTTVEIGGWVNLEDCQELLKRLSATGECHNLEVILRARDDRKVPVLLSASAIEIQWEPCLISVFRDISESKLLEDQFRQAQKMEAVGQLAGGVAHDYNNILTATLIQLGLLLDDPHLAPEVKNPLRELQHAAERAANLTRQLLMFSRREIIQVKPLDLNEVLADLVKMLRRLLGELISLEFQGGIVPLWIEADMGMMEQVVLNLCVNARDALLPKGGRLMIDARRVELGAEALRKNSEARPGTFVCLAVTDNGCGMDAAVLKHLFEPFFTTKEAGRGTGLGLATVYGITKKHRGWIDVTSRVGQGSAFRVYLPALSEGPPAEPKAAQVEVKRGSETILLVEDEELVRQTAAMTLRWYGYRVLEAADGTEAIRVWDEHAGEIDLLFSDMVMPGGFTGLELFKRFKPTKTALKAVISSGYGAVLRGSAPPPGSEIAYLAKPYRMTALACAVRDCLDQA